MANNTLFVVIPVRNRKEFTSACLISLRRQTSRNFKTIVIDDGSTDGTSEMIAQEFPEVILSRGDGSLWWTGATNVGVQYALDHGGEYIMTLNDDTVATEDYVEEMIFWSQKEQTALLGAYALEADTRKPIYGGEIINWKTAGSTSLLDTLPPDQWHGLHEVTHFPGRGLLIPSEVFRKVGLFDAKRFPQSGADYDFTHRAVRAGYKVFCNYDAKLLIYPDASGDAQLRRKKSLKNYYYHLFGLKGGGNLKRFWRYAISNCPKAYLPAFLFCGISRRILGYLIEWIGERSRK